jgi:hypothetical protein
MYPTAVVSILHPGDIIGFNAWLQGLEIPQSMTTGMLIMGVLLALLYVAVLSLLQLVLVVMVYRRARFYTELFPVTILVACLGAAIWWIWTGYFDLLGALTWAVVIATTVACEQMCQRLGAEFVFGADRPDYDPEY